MRSGIFIDFVCVIVGSLPADGDLFFEGEVQRVARAYGKACDCKGCYTKAFPEKLFCEGLIAKLPFQGFTFEAFLPIEVCLCVAPLFFELPSVANLPSLRLLRLARFSQISLFRSPCCPQQSLQISAVPCRSRCLCLSRYLCLFCCPLLFSALSLFSVPPLKKVRRS